MFCNLGVLFEVGRPLICYVGGLYAVAWSVVSNVGSLYADVYDIYGLKSYVLWRFTLRDVYVMKLLGFEICPTVMSYVMRHLCYDKLTLWTHILIDSLLIDV